MPTIAFPPAEISLLIEYLKDADVGADVCEAGVSADGGKEEPLEVVAVFR